MPLSGDVRPEYAQTIPPQSWPMAVFEGCLKIIVLPYELTFRHTFGERYFGIVTTLGAFFLPIVTLIASIFVLVIGFIADEAGASDTFVELIVKVVYFIDRVLMIQVVQSGIIIIAGFCHGDAILKRVARDDTTIHTRYSGTPWLWDLLQEFYLPWRLTFVKRYVEPIMLVVMAISLSKNPFFQEVIDSFVTWSDLHRGSDPGYRLCVFLYACFVASMMLTKGVMETLRQRARMLDLADMQHEGRFLEQMLSEQRDRNRKEARVRQSDVRTWNGNCVTATQAYKELSFPLKTLIGSLGHFSDNWDHQRSLTTPQPEPEEPATESPNLAPSVDEAVQAMLNETEPSEPEPEEPPPESLLPDVIDDQAPNPILDEESETTDAGDQTNGAEESNQDQKKPPKFPRRPGESDDDYQARSARLIQFRKDVPPKPGESKEDYRKRLERIIQMAKDKKKRDAEKGDQPPPDPEPES